MEDETEVRNAIERDLMGFSNALCIETTEDIADAWEVINEIDADGDVLALTVRDHRMPGTIGIEFMGQVVEDERTALTRKILLIGQANLTNTIHAVTGTGLDWYVVKPWETPELQEIVCSLLTDYIELAEIELMPYLGVLDPQRAMQIARHHNVAGWCPTSNLPAVG